MYYLETNSLRTLLPRISDKNFKENSFTSIISLIELLTGFNSQKEFQLRKNILYKVIDSGIAINFELPEDRFLKSFGIYVIPDHKEFTERIIQIFLTIDDFVTVDDTFEKESLTEFWNHFKKFDQLGEETLKTNFKGKTQEFRNEYVNGREFHHERWDKDYHQNHIDLFLEPVIRAFAGNIAKNAELNKKGLSVERLISAYDGTCNKYLAASNYYADLKVILGTEPGANDYFDLNHISYLEEDTNIIVTDDKMIFKVCSKLFPNQILRTKDI